MLPAGLNVLKRTGCSLRKYMALCERNSSSLLPNAMKSWGLSRGWNNVTDQVSLLESRTEQWLFSWLEFINELGYGRRAAFSGQTVTRMEQSYRCLLYEWGQVNWSVQEQREFMYFVSSDYRLAANGHTMLNACDCFTTWNCKHARRKTFSV